MNTLKAAAALLLLLGGTAQAAPIDVDFSFTTTIGLSGAGTGPVTGELVFAGAGTNVAATDAYVFIAPAGILNAAEFGEDFFPAGDLGANAFTVSASGVVSTGELDITDSSLEVVLTLNDSGISELDGPNGGRSYAYTPVTYSSPTATVPEPASVALFGASLLALAMIRRRWLV